jgi:hypothetical protein
MLIPANGMKRGIALALTTYELLIVLSAILAFALAIGLSLAKLGRTDAGAYDEYQRRKMVLAVIGPNGTLMQAIGNFKSDTGRFPAALMDLIEKPKDDYFAQKWISPYLTDKIAIKDLWDNDFQYASPGVHNKNGVDLWSKGRDGISGNQDDIVNWERSE